MFTFFLFYHTGDIFNINTMILVFKMEYICMLMLKKPLIILLIRDNRKEWTFIFIVQWAVLYLCFMWCNVAASRQRLRKSYWSRAFFLWTSPQLVIRSQNNIVLIVLKHTNLNASGYLKRCIKRRVWFHF